MNTKSFVAVLSVCGATIVVSSVISKAGGLNPPPGPIQPSGRNLNDVFTISEGIFLNSFDILGDTVDIRSDVLLARQELAVLASETALMASTLELVEAKSDATLAALQMAQSGWDTVVASIAAADGLVPMIPSGSGILHAVLIEQNRNFSIRENNGKFIAIFARPFLPISGCGGGTVTCNKSDSFLAHPIVLDARFEDGLQFSLSNIPNTGATVTLFYRLDPVP